VQIQQKQRPKTETEIETAIAIATESENETENEPVNRFWDGASVYARQTVATLARGGTIRVQFVVADSDPIHRLTKPTFWGKAFHPSTSTDATTTKLGPSSQSSGATRSRRGAPRTHLKRALWKRKRMKRKEIKWKKKKLNLYRFNYKLIF